MGRAFFGKFSAGALAWSTPQVTRRNCAELNNRKQAHRFPLAGRQEIKQILGCAFAARSWASAMISIEI